MRLPVLFYKNIFILAPIAAISFFVIAVTKIIKGAPHVFRNDKKDKAESGKTFSKLRKSSLLLKESFIF